METQGEVVLTRQWFRLRRSALAAGGTYDEVEFDPLLENRFLQITRISVIDVNNAPTKIRLYVKGHGYEHWVGEETTVVANTLYWIEWPTYIAEGEQLVARFYGATANDVLTMLVEGWSYDPPTIQTVVNVTVVPAAG